MYGRNGLWFERETTWKGAGWWYILNIEEPFDPSKLYFAKTPYFEDQHDSGYEIRYVDFLRYEGGEIEFEEEDGFFEEQYWDENIRVVKTDEYSKIIDPEDIEKYRNKK